MRSFKHWTPRYIYRRLGLSVYQWRYPNAPWLVHSMVEILENWLRPTDRGVEWGSGRSTVWFAERVGSLVSVEHSAEWYERVSSRLKQKGLQNVEYYLREGEADYCKVADTFSSESFDFCLVDGLARDDCALAALSLAKPGGIIIVDNCNCYLPSNSRSPYSRRPEQGCYTEKWATYLDAVREWRQIWTTDGVCDTGLWVKPTKVAESRHGRDLSDRVSVSLVSEVDVQAS
jgi:protein-L-isoaspartate O-methyltransferase